MRIFGDRRLSRLASAAFSLGAILTEPKRRRAVVSDLSGRLDDAKDAVSGRYRSVAESATEILQNRSKLASHALAVTVGIGMGVGLGLLLGPGRGKKTRDAIKDEASDFKSKVVEAAQHAASEMPSHLPIRAKVS